MGEVNQRAVSAQTHDLQPIAVDAFGGRIYVQWDHNASASPNAKLAFFAEFLQTTGLCERWVSTCHLCYNSPNAPQVRDVLGTWLLAIWTYLPFPRTV